MQQLMYAGEVRPISEIDIPNIEVRDAELKLAKQLIDQQTSATFDPAQYADEVTERIEKAVQKKVEGEEITMAAAPEGGGAQVIDLMEALRASLEKKGVKPAVESRGRAEGPQARKARAGREPRRRRRAGALANSGRRCTSTVCATSKSCWACRAARSAR